MRNDRYVVFFAIGLELHEHGMSGRVSTWRINLESTEDASVDVKSPGELRNVVFSLVVDGEE